MITLRNSENANKTINDLLDFAKPREITLAHVNISDVIDGACFLVKGRFSHQRVRLTKKISKELPEFFADEKSVQSAFVNIIINALDAMLEGGRLVIDASFDSEENEIEIRFADTGKGIPKEHMDKLFKLFFSTREDGTGLGLALVHQIINAHKGRINVESEVGKGTEVSIRLPVSKQG